MTLPQSVLARAAARVDGLVSLGCVLAALLGACSGGGSDDTGAQQRMECQGDAPPRLRSTSHRVGVPSSEAVIEIAWERSADATGYAAGFSRSDDAAPEELEGLPADARATESAQLADGTWYLHFRTEREAGEALSAVCGPYLIEHEAGDGDAGSGGGGGSSNELVTLTIESAGGSSVQYFTNDGERHFCGDTSLSGHPVQCTAEFVRGSEARIQRTLSLPEAEELRYRLSAWGGDCSDLDADVEPRGGNCRLLMDRNRDVAVTFERRARLNVAHQSPDEMSIRWELDYAPRAQKGGGSSGTRAGTFDCRFPELLPACEIEAFYDVGTVITLKAGNGSDDVSNFRGWDGACASFGRSGTCMFTLEEDVSVGASWSYQ